MKLPLFFRLKELLRDDCCRCCEEPMPGNSLSYICDPCLEDLGLEAAGPPVYEWPEGKVYAVAPLHGTLKKTLYQYKFYGQVAHAPWLADVLIAGWSRHSLSKSLRHQRVLLVSIPSHQNTDSHLALIQDRVSDAFDYETSHLGLRWHRETACQHHIPSRSDRLKNLHNSLSLTLPDLKSMAEYDAIIVLDDLVTTGATLKEAFRAIRTAAPSWEGLLLGLTLCYVPEGSASMRPDKQSMVPLSIC